MKLAPGTPLAANLTFCKDQPPLPVCRLAMANDLAQLEWSPELIDTTIEEVRAAVADWVRFTEEVGVTKASSAEIAAAHKNVAAGFSART